MSKVYVCRKLFLYDFLVKHNFTVIGSRADMYDQKKLVWLFEDTPKLRDAIEEYYSSKQTY